MAYTADVNRWRGPAEEPYRPHMLDSPWHPGWIAVTVLGFIIWWPIGLALLFFTLGSRKMGCWSHQDRWSNKMERMQYKMERMRNRMERRGFPFGPPSSGNRAFDEYRMETLRRLEEEQTEFRDFLDRLRHAKDKEEFDQFMAQHRPRPTPPRTASPRPKVRRLRASGDVPPRHLTATKPPVCERRRAVLFMPPESRLPEQFGHWAAIISSLQNLHW